MLFYIESTAFYYFYKIIRTLYLYTESTKFKIMIKNSPNIFVLSTYHLPQTPIEHAISFLLFCLKEEIEKDSE